MGSFIKDVLVKTEFLDPPPVRRRPKTFLKKTHLKTWDPIACKNVQNAKYIVIRTYWTGVSET